jgi:ABC-2 type transport system ATP-binding protein
LRRFYLKTGSYRRAKVKVMSRTETVDSTLTEGSMPLARHESLVIHTHGLSKAYGATVALRGLNLMVPRNSIFGFLGPNGAGKTTTIKLLLGLIRPTEGGGTVFGHDITDDNIEIRRRVGYLAQVPSYYMHMTAREILRFKARFFYAGPRGMIEERVEETLEMVELDDKADRPIKGFSGGERQRLGIAQAQVHRPDLLILDEPAANLDPMGRRDVLRIMESLRENATVFYSTHILDDVQRVSDAVAILNQGRLLAQAPIEELLAGSGGVVYYITIKGGYDEVYTRISGQEWVSSIGVVPGDVRTTLQVGVTDEAVAEDELLRLAMCDGDTVVTEFGRRRFELEDVFVDLVEGSNNGQ